MNESMTRSFGANNRQVGGGHYQARTQAWDFCIDNNVNPLTFNIIAYLTRWERKGNLEDLDKAQHYMDKMRELIIEGRLIPSGGPARNQRPLAGPLPKRDLPPAPVKPTPVGDLLKELQLPASLEQPLSDSTEAKRAHQQTVRDAYANVEKQNRLAAGSNVA